MQLYALDDQGPVSVKQAILNNLYVCPACGSSVRLCRKPPQPAHFYHITAPKNCPLAQKNAEHLLTQLRLSTLLGETASGIEVPFPSIQRIADVVWQAQHLVFVIQCAPLSLEEAQKKEADYALIGYHLIWILHDTQFNKRTFSAAEAFLRERNGYFTNINKKGEGLFYDQFEVTCYPCRYIKGPPLPINPTLLTPIERTDPQKILLPRLLTHRLERGSLRAQGDLLDRICAHPHPEEVAGRLLQTENKFLKKEKKRKALNYLERIRSSYHAMLQALLRKASS